jgi:hypothetical protein
LVAAEVVLAATLWTMRLRPPEDCECDHIACVTVAIQRVALIPAPREHATNVKAR